jgi:hypothetical protein
VFSTCRKMSFELPESPANSEVERVSRICLEVESGGHFRNILSLNVTCAAHVYFLSKMTAQIDRKWPKKKQLVV